MAQAEGMAAGVGVGSGLAQDPAPAPGMFKALPGSCTSPGEVTEIPPAGWRELGGAETPGQSSKLGLSFWGSQGACPWCTEEVPEIATFWKEREMRGFE